MKKNFVKIGAVAMIMVMLASMLAMPSSAYIAFNTYNYDFYGETVVTPSGYTPEATYYSDDLGIDELTHAMDLYVSPQNEIYILDYYGSESEPRLHIFDSNFKLIKTLSTLTANGNPYHKVGGQAGLRKTMTRPNSLAHRTTWLRSDLVKVSLAYTYLILILN